MLRTYDRLAVAQQVRGGERSGLPRRRPRQEKSLSVRGAERLLRILVALYVGDTWTLGGSEKFKQNQQLRPVARVSPGCHLMAPPSVPVDSCLANCC